MLSTRKGVVTRVEGQAKDNSDRSSRSSNPQVNAVNDARRANIAAGLGAYSGAGATALSASKGKGGYNPDKDYAGLPDFSKGPGGLDTQSALPQPIPEAPQAPVSPESTGEASFEQAKQNLASGGLTGGALTAAQTSLSNRYNQGHAAAQASGSPPPASPGMGMSGVSTYLPPEAPNSSVVDDIFSNDPVVGQLMSGITQLLNPKNQTTSLMQDYKKMRKDSGLDDINEELIDAETVLDGTEDDIRNEIQTAGGFGTESQVQAMTLARNKGLLKRYNQLVQMKTDATNNLNTMMQLNAQDKQMAQERINTTISTMFNMANFRQTALQNTRQQQQWMVQTMGADGYYATVSKDPRQLAMAEKILGVAPGGLQAVAVQAAEQKAFERSVQQAQVDIARGNLAVSQGNAAENRRHNLATEAGGDMTADEKKKAEAQGQLINLLGQYKTKLQGTGFLARYFQPEKKAELESLKGQITAVYKTAQQLGTLDAGVQKLVDSIIPSPTGFGLTSLSTGAQIKAIDQFTANQGGAAANVGTYADYKNALGI